MSQHYSDPDREELPHALPDLETFQADAMECDHCGATFPDPDTYPIECPECGKRTRAACSDRNQWWWWSCFPGCLPDSDPIGPFNSEAEALADARDYLG